MYVLKNIFLQYGDNVRLNIGYPNAVLIKNTGTINLFINKFPLAPGDVFTSNLLNPDMVDETIYSITFDPVTVGTKLVNVICSYVSKEKNINNGPEC